MKVKDLKQLLEETLETLNNYDEELDIPLKSNTYFLGYPNAFLGIAGSNGGYLALDYLEDTLAEVESEDEE